ncbi:hypothetical protein A4A49_33444 [Nicotiana attenuata]|uniref:DUF4283 domain-containing protein n=1 Tax=Nicotiana attenuata TaxID=49451 RepID=A0A1J6ISX5_NICAT|nr:hypothetical protein A4A49_33444 [Nicotiana attenuata]
MQTSRVPPGNNRAQEPSTSRSNDQMVSKQSFVATVQTKLQTLTNGETAVEIRHRSHLGKPAVFFSAEDYFSNLAQECKLTIIVKFLRGKPSMEEIRKIFVRKFHMTGTVKIAYFDPQYVYIDFSNEVDYNHIRFKEYIDIGDAPMKILKWTADFKPEEETTIVPVWILVHQLPWHLFNWRIISRMVREIGVAFAPDLETYSKSRGNVAKVKVEVDLLKPRLD